MSIQSTPVWTTQPKPVLCGVQSQRGWSWLVANQFQPKAVPEGVWDLLAVSEADS